MQTSTLRPGLLVSLKSEVRGGVKYAKKTIKPETVTADGRAEAAWQTERTVYDKAEHERAGKARSNARAQIHNCCILSAFGYLCPEEKAADLEAAIAASRRIADEFNVTAKVTHLSVYVMVGRIAPDDVEAVRAINDEVKVLLEKMEAGVRNLEAEQIRDAAKKARRLGEMLTNDAKERIQGAIEAARKAARNIAKAGEEAAAEVDLKAIAAITDARTAFLDLDEEEIQEVIAPAMVAPAVDLVPEAELKPPATKRVNGKARALDLDTGAEVPAAAAKKRRGPARQLELD